MKTSILSSFPFLAELSKEELDQLIHVDVKTGHTILSEGDCCHTVAFVYSGEMKITKINKNGREVNLYKVSPGQTCILTVTSTLSNQPYPAYAIASQDTKLFLIEKRLFMALLRRNDDLQKLINQTTADRFINLMGLFDDLFFRRIDERVVDFLLENLHDDQSSLPMTHEEIAAELGTSREVVSRVMKHLEKAGCIRLARGKVWMLSREKLSGILTKL
jgi:CRP/FNR family transcriptional regulator, anaerobic regulatory protein